MTYEIQTIKTGYVVAKFNREELAADFLTSADPKRSFYNIVAK